MTVTATTTIAVVFTEFLQHMRGLEGVSPSGSPLAIQKVAEGEAPLNAYARPFIVVQLLSAKVTGRADIDRIWTVDLKVRIVTEVTTNDGATPEILAHVAAVDDRIEAYQKPAGVDGFVDAEWSVSFPTDPAVGAIVMADSLVSFTVKVAKGSN